MKLIEFRFFLMALISALGVVACSQDASKVAATDSIEEAFDLAKRLPLKTQSRFIVDNVGKRFKLKSVNWYGASDEFNIVLGLDIRHRDDIAQSIKTAGFNSVRLPFSNEMLRIEESVDRRLISANPDLYGKKPLEIFDAIIAALAKQNILVILNNHTTKSQWCCGNNDNDGLWYNEAFTEDQWVKDWEMLTKRYKANPLVVGADLRNELRRNNKLNLSPRWGGGGKNDWKRAAKRAGNAILDINPNMLIIIEGLDYAAQLRSLYSDPLELKIDNRLVYSFHSYSFFKSNGDLYDVSEQRWGSDWGYILSQGQSYTAPVWVSEFGTSRGDNDPIKPSKTWWNHLMCYLQKSDIDFAYWALNGSKLAKDAKSSLKKGADIYVNEPYGLLDRSWNYYDQDWRLNDITHYLLPTRQGPGVNASEYEPCVAVFGGRNGSAFDHSDFVSQKLSRIRIEAGDVVDSIDITYGLQKDALTLRQGGDGGSSSSDLILEADEYITEMQVAIKYYKGSQTVAGLRFDTNKRKNVITIGDYSLGSDGVRAGFENYIYQSGPERFIAGFKGRSGNYLDSIGPIYRNLD
jgi:endoglucanase